jgi:2,4-dienoyl-CoA reductase-like NADH-dependent reductase (Old Yellow Enzyme family)/pyruvate/2-oxoglutarate dehydrogenase complex dihydrolipoamide dehydrogenase (E3) component
MTQLAKLFQPGRIGKMEIRNRIVMAPMATAGADDEGTPTARMIDYFVARAKGGVGLIIAGSCTFSPEARPPKQLTLYDDKYIPKFKILTQAVHEHGAKIFLQFNHLGRRMSLAKFAFAEEQKKRVISSSAVKQVTDGSVPIEATQEDIDSIVEAWADGCRRAKEAGFDGTELHAAHGYLLSSFLSPATNKRIDGYGGSPEKRARFACEVISRIRSKVGKDFAISIRFSGCDYLRGGITIEDTLRQVPLFVEAGADVLHVSASAPETLQYQFLPYMLSDGMIVHLAEAIKAVVNVPVITVGKLGNPVVANRVLDENKADFIALARPLLADPALPNKAQEGRLDEINRCLCCNACCAMSRDERRQFGGLRCTVNPDLFREREFVLKPAEASKRVMVVGGGIAGMEVSRVLAERGHDVTLYERGEKLGGQWNIVVKQESKEVYSTLTKRLSRGLKNTRAKVILNKEVTSELVKEIRPEAIVIATGAEPILPDIPGIDRENVVQANDVITGKASVGDRVVVIGGRLIGLEVADFLARKGKKVSMITRNKLGGSGKPPDHNTLRVLMDRFIENGVSLYPHSTVFEIKEDGVYIDYEHQVLFGLTFLKADTVVLAMGSQASNGLFNEFKDIVPQIYKIGDCVEPRNVMECLKEANEIGRLI